MTEPKSTSMQSATENLEATKKFPVGTWRQQLKISRVGSTIYFDEGNGTFTGPR